MAGENSATSTSRIGHWVFVDEALSTKLESNDNPNNAPSTPTPESPVRHPKFFFDNALVTIRIENTLFNVHKYQLSKSEVFSDMFQVPKPTGDVPEEGSSPEHPIVLTGVAASDFTALLTVLYASHFSSDRPTLEPSLIIPAYRLANMFNFSELRAFLLPLVETSFDDVDKIVFSREFDIKEWLTPTHIRLCQREKLLDTEEARKLGVDSVLIISRMREQHRNRIRTSPFIYNNYYCYSCGGMNHSSSSHDCSGCGGTYGAGYLRYRGPGRIAQNVTPTTDNAAIEAGVKKWVEGGCTVEN